MKPRYLLDTNIVSEPLRSSPNASVLEKLYSFQEQLAIASVVWHELLFGCYRLAHSAKRAAIETYLHQVVAVSMAILPYDEAAAQWHAVERARLAALGRTPPFADGQIAAIARVNELILVTFNQPDFASFQGVQLEDWRI